MQFVALEPSLAATNPKVQQDFGHINMVKELIKNNVLVVTTGCNAQACAKAGLLRPEAAYLADEGRGADHLYFFNRLDS